MFVKLQYALHLFPLVGPVVSSILSQDTFYSSQDRNDSATHLHNVTKRPLSLVGHSNMSPRSIPFSNSQDGVDSAGFYYSLYNANGANATYTEFDNSGEFMVGWSSLTVAEFLGGKGFEGGDPRSLAWDGYFTAEGDWTLAVYGWTTDPVSEWYIVEDHGSGTPGNGDVLGQVDSDGGVYDVYKMRLENVSEIYGVTSFDQYWSVRQIHRTSGMVDVAAHFDGWKGLGLSPGSPVFQMIALESFQGQGYLDFVVS